MAKNVVLVSLVVVSSSLLLGPHPYAAAQSIKVFGPTVVRDSTSGTSFTQPNTFNSATINLSCPASGIHAVLSSTSDGTGNILVDNFIRITVTNGTTVVSGPANVCQGGTTDQTPSGVVNNCFNATYRSNYLSLIGQNLDSYAATGGVPPIDVSNLFVPGIQQVKIEEVDGGVVLTSTSVYLMTNCTQTGVTGPATITGNPIPGNNPPPDRLLQLFDFNSKPDQKVEFIYDLSTSQGNGLTITDGTIPSVSDAPLDPALWQSQYVPGTSFATSNCLVHTGELLNGSPACKLFTLDCTVGTGATGTGAQCPVSSMPNEVFSDIFTGPGILLPDILGPDGNTYHQGVSFLEASEGWTGGACQFDAASGFQGDSCP